MIEWLVLVPYPLALTWAMCSDLARLRIPNAVPIILVVAFLVAAVARAVPFDVIALQLGLGAAAFVIGFIPFLLGAMGGGDTKLIAAIVPWIDPQALPGFLIWVAMMGGVLAVLVLLFRRLPYAGLPRFERFYDELDRGETDGPDEARSPGKPRIVLPYGVAIGCAGLITLPNLSLIAN